MSDRGLLSDVADAVAAQQEVDWDRCAQRALPDERNAIDHLRTFAGICRAVGRAGTPAGPLVDRDGHGSRLVRRAVGVLVVVALLQSVVGLATGVTLLPAATEGMLAALAGPLVPDVRAVSPTGFLPVSEMTPAASFFRIVPHVLYPVCGLLLFVGGRFDRRAWLLGAVLVLLGAFWAQPGDAWVSALASIPSSSCRPCSGCSYESFRGSAGVPDSTTRRRASQDLPRWSAARCRWPTCRRFNR